jgi:glycerol-3-phosphate O-acyltransferase
LTAQDRGLRRATDVVERFADPLGDLIRVREEQAPLLAYFRNNVLHLFALPAVLACLLSHNRRSMARAWHKQ